MEKIPLQTLKNVEKVPSETQIDNITIEVHSVLRNFKPTVRSRREYEPDEEVDFDVEFDKEFQKIDSAVENVHLRETLPKIETELNLWVREYKHLLDEYKKLHDDNIKDQVFLKQSDDEIHGKLSRVAMVENIKNSLMTEVKKLCLHMEKSKVEADDKLKRSTDNFKEIIRYLNRGFETERLSYYNTVELLRKLEHTLRDSYNKCENAQSKIEVLESELKKTKQQLHSAQYELIEERKVSHKATIQTRSLQIDLDNALDRAEIAEKALNRLRHKF